MQEMWDRIGHIPADAVRQNLTIMLGWRDFVRLDSALLCKTARTAFMEWLSFVTVRWPLRTFPAAKKSTLLRWCIQRNIKMANLSVSVSFHEVLSLVAANPVTELTIDCHDHAALKQLEDALSRAYSKPVETKFGLILSCSHGKLTLGNVALFHGRLSCLSWSTSDIHPEIAAKLVQGNPHLHTISITAPAQSDLALVTSLGRSLVDLTLAAASLTDKDLSALAHECPCLQRVHLSSIITVIGLLDSGLAALAAGCPELRHVEVNDFEVSDDAVTALCTHCPALEVVHLHAGYLTSDAVSALSARPAHWKTVSIGWRVSAGTELATMHAALGSVQALVLTAVIPTCACALTLMLPCLPSLVSLKFRARHSQYNQPFPAQGMFDILRSCTSVRDINISQCIEGLTDDIRMKMFARCAKLRSIHCEASGMQFGDDVLRAVAMQCPLLVSVQLAAAASLTDTGIAALAHSCPRLQCIRISGIKGIARVALYAMARYSTDLRTLHLHGSVHATEDEVLRLLQRCARLHTVDIPSVLVTARGTQEVQALLGPRKRACD